ncbi:hypothetical protein PIB30_115879, partial [Stylosanthes scabra]|nr:hypothetical protein [Stylosanthes scabra]
MVWGCRFSFTTISDAFRDIIPFFFPFSLPASHSPTLSETESPTPVSNASSAA